MDELPANHILNKGMTGCGATSVAIRQSVPTIIAMPFVGLIENKISQCKDGLLLGIYGDGDKRQEISDYMESHWDCPKILTKVCRILEEIGYSPYARMHLAVDE